MLLLFRAASRVIHRWLPTPASRTYVVPGESRVCLVPLESRVYLVEA